MTLDDARYLRPELGFGVYAYEPRGVVTVEVHQPDGTIMSAVGATESEALQAILGPVETLVDLFD